MILILDKYVLPNIKPDLSDLVESYAYNVYHYDPYRNHVINKYELSKHWRVPFIELKHLVNNKNNLEVIIGTYDFESVKRGVKLIHIDARTSTLYDYLNCPRREGSISFYDFGLEYYSLIKVEASYQNLGNHKYEKRYSSGFIEVQDEYSNELVSFVFKFKKGDFQFEISSEDLVHKLVKYDINKYEYRETDYKKTIFLSHNPSTWYDYGEAQSIFNLVNTLKAVDSLVKDGLKIEDIDFTAFGTRYVEGKMQPNFRGFASYDDFLYSIACSKVSESDGMFMLSFCQELSSKLISYYRFLFEQIVGSPIEKSQSGYWMRISKSKFEDKSDIIPYLLLNVLRNAETNSDYTKYIYAQRFDSDDKYSKLINLKGPIKCLPFELRVKDILDLKAKDEYRVLYRTGDRDDIWWKEKHIKIEFRCKIDSATIYAIKQAIPGINRNGNVFEYSEEDSGHDDRISIGHDEDYSKDYKAKIVTCLCKTMYSLYKSGIWDGDFQEE